MEAKNEHIGYIFKIFELYPCRCCCSRVHVHSCPFIHAANEPTWNSPIWRANTLQAGLMIKGCLLNIHVNVNLKLPAVYPFFGGRVANQPQPPFIRKTRITTKKLRNNNNECQMLSAFCCFYSGYILSVCGGTGVPLSSIILLWKLPPKWGREWGRTWITIDLLQTIQKMHSNGMKCIRFDFISVTLGVYF